MNKFVLTTNSNSFCTITMPNWNFQLRYIYIDRFNIALDRAKQFRDTYWTTLWLWLNSICWHTVPTTGASADHQYTRNFRVFIYLSQLDFSQFHFFPPLSSPSFFKYFQNTLWHAFPNIFAKSSIHFYSLPLIPAPSETLLSQPTANTRGENNSNIDPEGVDLSQALAAY